MDERFLPMVPRRATWIAAIGLLMALGADAAAAQIYVRLQNRWTGSYLSVCECSIC